MRKLLLIWLSVLMASPAWAVTIDAQTVHQGAVNALTKAHTTGSGTNRGGVLGCAVRNNTVVLTATYAGNSLTEIRRDQSGGTSQSSWLFYIIAPTSGANDWVVTQSGGNSYNLACYFETYTDSKQTSPVTDSTGSCASGTSISNTVTTATNELVLDVIGINAVSATLSQGADQTDVSGTPVEQGSTITVGASTQDGANGGVMSWTWTGSVTGCQSAVSIGHEAASSGSIRRRDF